MRFLRIVEDSAMDHQRGKCRFPKCLHFLAITVVSSKQFHLLLIQWLESAAIQPWTDELKCAPAALCNRRGRSAF